MEKENKQLNISRVIYGFLLILIILLSSFLIWSLYINDLYREFEPFYSENCYKVEHDENSVTLTIYYKDSEVLSSSEKYNFENGKLVSCYTIDTYKSKSVTNEIYKKSLEYENTIKRTGKNIIEKEQKFQESDLSYDSEYLKEKYQSFTTNEEVIKFALEYAEKNNFNFPSDFKRIE